MIDIADLPHFRAALGMTARRGTCFHRAVAFVLDVPTAHLELGTFRAATDAERAWYREHRPDEIESLSPVPFIHAWVVVDGGVIAPTLYEQRGFLRMPRQAYLDVNGASDVRRVLRGSIVRLARLRGLGPHLKRGKPIVGGGTLGEVLLDEAGIAWTENALGGVVPA